MNTRLLIAAAGLGERLGGRRPKALVPLMGRPLLLRTLDRFREAGLTEGVVLVPPGWGDGFSTILAGRGLRLVEGGTRRQDSVGHGLAALDDDAEVVVIHDAARPFVSVEAIRASIEAAVAFGAATVAIPSIDTILEGDAEGFLQSTPERSRLWACQTPQTFRVEVIREAHRRATAEGFEGTDDASLVRRMGGRVKLVMGSRHNLKITLPEDLRLAEAMVREELA